MGEKRYDAAELLGQISGLGRSEVMRVWAEAKANSARLDECVGPHDFQCPDAAQLGAKFTCSKCGGVVSGRDADWYARGLRHGP